MKYIISITLVLLLLLSACTTPNPTYEDPVSFYYIQNDVVFGSKSGVMKKTVREAGNNAGDYFELTKLYLNGPTTYDCVSPFPAGTTLEELHWDQNRIQVLLSPQITTLSGSELTVACACLTRTLTEMTGIRTVQIRSTVGLLNGEKVLTMSADSIIYWDEADPSDTFD